MGGVGLRKASTMNKSLLAKLAWRVVTEDDAIWCNVLREKYGLSRGDGFEFTEKQRDSRIWKGVVWGRIFSARVRDGA